MRTIFLLILSLLIYSPLFCQLNSSAKSLRLFNADSLTIQTEVSGLELMYDSVAAMYYNTSSNKLRCYTTGVGWFDCGGGGGGGSVTSVGLVAGTTGTDVNISGSPVTTSGDITINIPDASTTARGLVTTGTQTIAGTKTFNGAAANTTFNYNSNSANGVGVEIQQDGTDINGAILNLYNRDNLTTGRRIYEFHGYANNSIGSKIQYMGMGAEVISTTAGSETGRFILNVTDVAATPDFTESIYIQPSTTTGGLYERFCGGCNTNGATIGSFANASNGNNAFAEWRVTDNPALTGSTNDALRMVRLGDSFTTTGQFLQNSGVIESASNLAGGLSISAAHTTGDIRFYTGGANNRMEINQSGALSFATNFGTAGQVLQSNGNAAAPTWVVPSIGGITTADNGLNLSTATNVQLGGDLLMNTDINTTASGFILNINATSGGAFSVTGAGSQSTTLDGDLIHGSNDLTITANDNLVLADQGGGTVMTFESTSNDIVFELSTAVTGDVEFNMSASNNRYIIMTGLPTSVTGLPTGALYDSLGFIKIAP